MPEVINLLSSSPLRPDMTTTATSVHRDSIPDVLDLGSDIFDVTGDLDFPIEQPAKRRKVSPLSSKHTSSREVVFDLSSEPDAPPVPFQSHSEHDKEGVASDKDDLGDVYDLGFSSSAPEPMQRNFVKRSEIVELSSDDGLAVEDILKGPDRPKSDRTRPVFSEKTASLLSRIDPKPDRPHKVTGLTKPSKIARTMSLDERGSEKFRRADKATTEDIFDSSQYKPTRSNAKKVSNLDNEDREDKSKSRAALKAAKDAEKELEKERKKREKEEKLQEKQRAADISEVNKSKTNKKNSTPEMEVIMPSSLKGRSLANQVEEHMKQLEVGLTYVDDEEVDLTNDVASTYGRIIRWRRKLIAEYDDDNELWKPLPKPRVTSEAHMIIFFTAEELVTLAVVGKATSIDDVTKIPETTMKANLDVYLLSLRQKYPECRPIFLVEGLVTWHKCSQNAKNRAYTAAVRSQVLPDTSEQSQSQTNPTAKPSRRKKPTGPSLDFSSITTEVTETLLLHLQLHHQPLQIHHTTSPTTSAAQISTFTQHLSTRPYRLAQQNANLASASFCMTTGQIRTGTTANETWVQMLQEINRVTPSMAYGIVAAGYKNPTELVRGFRRDGRLMLEDVRKSVNKDGGWSDRRLGPMVSKRVYKVFMGLDPAAMDGIA